MSTIFPVLFKENYILRRAFKEGEDKEGGGGGGGGGAREGRGQRGEGG